MQEDAPLGIARDDRGQDLIEYGLLASFIAITLIAAVLSVAESLNSLWAATSDRTTEAAGQVH